MLSDVKRAYFHALAQRELFVELPEEDPDYEPLEAKYKLIRSDIKKEDLPNVTLYTNIRDHEKEFKLLCENLNNTTYPKNKITWVIVDNLDKKDRYKQIDMNLLKDIKLSHYTVDKKGVQKAYDHFNFGIKMIKDKIILNYTPGYYYSAPSVEYRVRFLLGSSENTKIQCLTSINQLNYNPLNTQLSQMYPNLQQPYYERIVPASLTYFKDYAIVNKTVEHEGSFVKGNHEQLCVMPSANLLLKISQKYYNSTEHQLDKTMLDTIHNAYSDSKSSEEKLKNSVKGLQEIKE